MCFAWLTADTGGCSEKNLVFLESRNKKSYIKLQEHEKMKTRAYKEDIGEHYDMTDITEDDGHMADNTKLLPYGETGSSFEYIY